MKAGDPAGNILPQYMDKQVEIVLVEEKDECCCACIGLSDGTFWFIGDDCVQRIPYPIALEHVILTDAGYQWDTGYGIWELTDRWRD